MPFFFLLLNRANTQEEIENATPRKTPQKCMNPQHRRQCLQYCWTRATCTQRNEIGLCSQMSSCVSVSLVIVARTSMASTWRQVQPINICGTPHRTTAWHHDSKHNCVDSRSLLVRVQGIETPNHKWIMCYSLWHSPTFTDAQYPLSAG